MHRLVFLMLCHRVHILQLKRLLNQLLSFNSFGILQHHDIITVPYLKIVFIQFLFEYEWRMQNKLVYF